MSAYETTQDLQTTAETHLIVLTKQPKTLGQHATTPGIPSNAKVEGIKLVRSNCGMLICHPTKSVFPKNPECNKSVF
jgi:hypothetical protein